MKVPHLHLWLHHTYVSENADDFREVRRCRCGETYTRTIIFDF